MEQATSNRKLACMQLLIERGVNVDACGGVKYTPLHWACYNGYQEEARMLLNAGANVVAPDLKDEGQTPLQVSYW